MSARFKVVEIPRLGWNFGESDAFIVHLVKNAKLTVRICIVLCLVTPRNGKENLINFTFKYS